MPAKPFLFHAEEKVVFLYRSSCFGRFCAPSDDNTGQVSFQGPPRRSGIGLDRDIGGVFPHITGMSLPYYLIFDSYSSSFSVLFSWRKSSVPKTSWDAVPLLISF